MIDSPLIAPVYRGRFAPSPTGPLHFGSLVAAVGSLLQARSSGGEWLVRIEDLDAPRSMAGAADSILRTLEAFGLFWDGKVSYQSLRQKNYDDAIDQLVRKRAVYACSCTRSEIADSSVLGIDGPVYSGTCRNSMHAARALRVRTANVEIVVSDLIQGEMRWDLAREIGDFIVRRADGLHAYQLAVVVDDAAQNITEVVRGADLLHSTPRQIHLQRILGLPTPAYAHLPVATNAFGEKLSKQTLAAAIRTDQPVPILCEALAFLGQNPPPELRDCDLESVWHWAVNSWKTFKVPQVSPPVADLRFT